ncbi:MAG TPA: potassium transporter TrkG [Micromonosporaceae bacterium]|nr:potassium transporter TrkG [Micromonosporaceae bacterium]
MKARDLRARLLQNPVRLVPLVLLVAIAIGTAVLMLPISRAGDTGSAPFLDALTVATSSVCTAGLDYQDTAEYWSTFGHVVILLLTEMGGFGVIAMALLVILFAASQLGIRNRLVLQAEGAGVGLADTAGTLRRIGKTMLGWQAAIAVVLAVRLWQHYDVGPGRAIWYGAFHAVQAFNNSGFTLIPNDWQPFVADPWMCLPPTIGVIVGALGFPVLLELRRNWRRPSRWSLTTRLTVSGTAILLVTGTLLLLAFEWNHSVTLGGLDVPAKILAAFVQATIPRSGGLATLDYSAMTEESFAVVTALMFIGGGSASTAGGIKVTTFFLLAYVIWAEVRGEPDVVIGNRRVAEATQRQALTIALLGIGAIAGATLLAVVLSGDIRLNRVLFEVTSAFSTAGISTDVTPTLPEPVKYLFVLLIFLGRVGTIGALAALALGTRHRMYRYPEERALVG